MKIKKILLMVPPAFTFKSHRDINPLPPMGLGYLAAIIEKMGIEIKILDSLMLITSGSEIMEGSNLSLIILLCEKIPFSNILFKFSI